MNILVFSIVTILSSLKLCFNYYMPFLQQERDPTFSSLSTFRFLKHDRGAAQ